MPSNNKIFDILFYILSLLTFKELWQKILIAQQEADAEYMYTCSCGT